MRRATRRRTRGITSQKPWWLPWGAVAALAAVGLLAFGMYTYWDGSRAKLEAELNSALAYETSLLAGGLW